MGRMSDEWDSLLVTPPPRRRPTGGQRQVQRWRTEQPIEAADPPPSAGATREIHPRRVLVAEDDPVIMDLLTLTFELDGHAVSRVSKLADVVSALSSDQFDAVVLDGVLDGTPATEFLDMLPPNAADTPAIVLSTNTALTEDLRERGVIALSKPFDPDDLSALIERAISQRGESTGPSQDVAMALTAFDGSLRLVELHADGTYHFSDALARRHGLLYVSSLEHALLKGSIEEFEDLLNRPTTAELDFQKFFERNPEFLTGEEHIALHPHVALHRTDDTPLYPDFLLQPMYGPYGDILELKSPSSRVLVGRGNHPRLSSIVMSGCAQLRTYHDYFELKKHRQLIRDAVGFEVFRPQLFLIVGRRRTGDDPALRLAMSDIPQVNLRTYDDVLAKMKARLGT